MSETAYIVLRLDDIPDSRGWAEIARVQAASASAAIRKELGDLLPRDSSHAGTYVAIPARSFKPVTVSAVQTTVLKLEPPASPS